jgi:hypothetical protein
MSNHETIIEYEPHKDPDVVEDGYKVYSYPPAASSIVRDFIITRSQGDEEFLLWDFEGRGGVLRLELQTRHRHPPEYTPPHCQKWTLGDDEFPPLADAPEVPDAVRELAVKYSDAPVIIGHETHRDDSDLLPGNHTGSGGP